MQVEIWSDVVCPWCYIGKRRFEEALGRFEGSSDVEVIWRSFELDPSAPTSVETDMTSFLSEKYGASKAKAEESIAHITKLAADEGLVYHLSSARRGNSFDAHRLLQLASQSGLGAKMKERLLSAYFTDSLEISNREVLVKLGVETGLVEEDIRDMYSSDRMAASVRNDEALAARYGISGVPFFVFDSRYGVSGAQSVEVFTEVLNRVNSESVELDSLDGDDAPECQDESRTR